MTIVIGYWLIPLICTVIVVWLVNRRENETGGFGPDIGGLIYGGIGLVAILAAWCVYFAIQVI